MRSLTFVFLTSAYILATPVPQDSAAQRAGGNDSEAVGTWRGDSTCVTGASSCHDEKVVYYIKAVPGKPGVMFVRADKIAGGNAITMGAGEWEYDDAGHALVMRSQQRTWRLKLEGTQIEGTLTLSDGAVFRRMTLKKDQ